MFSFAVMQAKKILFFKRLSAIFILGVFILAITPWSTLHHHERHANVIEKDWSHTVHVKVSEDSCLICKAHFEKNFTSNFYNYIIHLKTELIKKAFPLIGISFTEIIATCLRGPPSLF